jgi:glycerol-3-phosphate acyltransferase PlsY
VSLARASWVVGGYLVGTLPSTLIVARVRRATFLLASIGRTSGERDAHVVLWRQLGPGWTAAAATFDVVKAFVYLLVADHVAHLPPPWLALVGVATVLGYTFPFYARATAGRGLAASAGVYLVLLPVQMTVAGVLILVGVATRNTSLFSTVGMASVPVVAAIQGQPPEYVALGGAVFALIVLRRLEGVGEVIRRGVSPGRAILYRAVFDSSEPPGHRRPVTGVGEEEEAPQA